jgi:hypothetical protein
MAHVDSLVGKVVEILYPIRNEIGSRPRLRARRILVETVRDLLLEPLTPEDVARRPYVRRGRFLLTGMDLSKGAQRSFYLDWNRVRRLQVLHGDGAPTKICSGKTRFEATCFAEMCSQLPRGMKITIKAA